MTTAVYASFWDKRKAIKYNIFNILCFTLAATVFFTNLIHLPRLGSKFQITEFVFLLAIPFIPYKKLIQHHLQHNRTFIYIIVVYLVFDLTSSILSHQASAILESAGRFYLLALFTILSYHFSLYNIKVLVGKLTYVLLLSSAAIIVLAICGYMQAFTKGCSPYIYIAHDYPYFGSMYRLIGPTIYPTMLISSLTFIILFLIGVQKNAESKLWVNIILALLFICALLTLSKSLVLLVFAVIIFVLKSFMLLTKRFLIFTTIVFTVVMVLFTHCILVRKSSPQAESLKSTIFTSNRVIFQNDKYVVLEANYLAVKRAAIHMVIEHPFFGIGTGNFNTALLLYKTKGLFPKKLPNFDPHSTYLGILVENGLFAEIMLLVLLGFVLKEFIKREDLLTDNFLLALFMIYLIFLIEGIATDIFNFRHLWLFFALALTWLQQTKPAVSS